MRFGAHQTFHLRDGWLFKGLHGISEDPKLFSSGAAAEKLGIGKNMAESLEYWLQACQLATKNEGLILSPLAKAVLKHDPYLEFDGTVLLIHYLLATNLDQATTWYWFFNRLAVTEFDTSTLSLYLAGFVEKAGGKKITESTLTRDVHCLLATYRKPRYDVRETPETLNISPFSRLELLAEDNGRYFRKSLDNSLLHPRVFAFLLYKFWSDSLQKPESMSFDEIARTEKSPGLVLGLTEDQTAGMIELLGRSYGGSYLQFNRTNGYFIVNVNESAIKNSLVDYYKEVLSLMGEA